MNRDQFLQYLRQPEKLDQASLENLQELISAFPYFPSGHMLLLKNLHNIRSIRFDSQLKVSSVFTHDRAVLYSLLHHKKDPAAEEPFPAPGSAEETNAEARKSPVAEEVSPEIPEEESVTNHEEASASGPDEEAPEISETGPEKPGPADEGEESTADRVLREVEEARRRISEGVPEENVDRDRGTVAGETPAEETELPEGEDQGHFTEDELFVLADDLPDDVPPADTLAVEAATGEILEIDEHQAEPGAEGQDPEESGGLEKDAGDSPSEKQSPEKTSEKPGTPEKKTPVAGGVSEKNLPESHSFSQWIALLSESGQSGQEEKPGPETGDIRQNDLIDRFLENIPRIIPRQDPDEQEDISLGSVEENEGMFTDTLAKIYVRQGYYSKAIFAYEKLCLKFPEKSSYFVAQMEKIQELIKQKSK